MTYGQAKKDFVIFAVFVHKKNKKGKWKLEELDLEKESIPDETEGRVGGFDYQEYVSSLLCHPRLCFIANRPDDDDR